MSSYLPGQSLRFSVTCTAAGAGLIDPTALTMTICQVKNHSVVLVSATVVRDSLGTYHADVLIPFGTKPGDYAARWLATGAAISSNGIKEDIFTILPLAF